MKNPSISDEGHLLHPAGGAVGLIMASLVHILWRSAALFFGFARGLLPPPNEGPLPKENTSHAHNTATHSRIIQPTVDVNNLGTSEQAPCLVWRTPMPPPFNIGVLCMQGFFLERLSHQLNIKERGYRGTPDYTRSSLTSPKIIDINRLNKRCLPLDQRDL